MRVLVKYEYPTSGNAKNFEIALTNILMLPATPYNTQV